MAFKCREELVGKRFLCISSPARLKLHKVCDWVWRRGVVRASSHRDVHNPDLCILVEFDDCDWRKREWICLYEHKFQVFLIEYTLTWTVRKETPIGSDVHWPALNYKPLLDKVGLSEHHLKPVEHLDDRQLDFVDYTSLKHHHESDFENQKACREYPLVRECLRQWLEFQDGQKILLNTPSVLVGYRVKVYRVEGTTQWYTAVIISYNEHTKELTLTDDTVLEEHNEDPTLVQIKLIGDGVVESILKGEEIGITPRRRASNQNHNQTNSHTTRTRGSNAAHSANNTLATTTTTNSPQLTASLSTRTANSVTSSQSRKKSRRNSNEATLKEPSTQSPAAEEMKMCKDLNAPHNSNPSNAAVVNGSHPTVSTTSTVDAQQFRQPMLPTHPNASVPKYNPAMNYEMLWHQKFAAVPSAQSPWNISQHIQEQQQQHEREKLRLDMEKKEEKERMEKAERERLEKEERERQQRFQLQQVQHHFDTSLRLANEKRIAEGFSPHPIGKIAGSTSSHSMAFVANATTKQRSSEKEKSSSVRDTQSHSDAKYREHEKWISQQQQRMVNAVNAQLSLQPPSPSHQRHNKMSVVENAHQESYLRKPSPSPVSSVNQSPKMGIPQRANSDQNFSLYGFQPFPTYITAAQLKENAKMKSGVMHPSGFSAPMVAQRPMVNPSRMTPVYGEKREPSPLMDRSVTPGSRNSTPIGRPPSLSPKHFHSKVSQERISPHVYQTHGAFKPYENPSISAPPAHQSSSPGLGGSRGGTPLPIGSPLLQSSSHMSQDQPQNLVKSEAKNRPQQPHPPVNSSVSRMQFNSAMIQQLQQEQRHNIAPHRTSASPTYNLIQGLIPNTNFTTAATTSPQTSIISSLSTHPRLPFTQSLVPQPTGYPLPTTTLDRNPQAAGITRGLPFSRPATVPVNLNECQPKSSDISHTHKAVNHHDRQHRMFSQEMAMPRPTPNNTDFSRKPPIVTTPRVVVAPVQSPYGPPPGRGLHANIQPSVPPMSSPPAAHTGVVPLDLHNKRRSPVDATVPKRSKKEEPVLPVFQTAASSISTNNATTIKMDAASDSAIVSCNTESVNSSSNSDAQQSSQKTTTSATTASDVTVDRNCSDNDNTQSSVSSVLTNSDSSSAKFHPKLKKAWLQRHSDEDKVDITNSVPSMNFKSMASLCTNKTNTQLEEESKEESVNGASDLKDKEDSKDDEQTSSASEVEPMEKNVVNKESKKAVRKRGISAAKYKESKRQKRNSTECETDEELPNKKEEKKKKGKEKEGKGSQKRGRKPKSARKDAKEKDLKEISKKKGLNNKIEKPPLAVLKKTGEPFLQNGPCCDVAPKLPRCRECKPTQRNKKIADIFCRFYAYRKIRFNKSLVITGAGFSEPKDADASDLKLWLPPEKECSDLSIDDCKFLIKHVGDQFCDLVKQEQQALKLHVGEDKTVTWKRVVQGVREMCDVCETTLFNIHWVCQKCGFVICIDCYKARKENTVKEEASPQKERDKYQWLLCGNRQPHEQDKLVMTQIIAGNALWEVGDMLHKVRKEWNIPYSCSCVSDTLKNSNGVSQHLITAVSKCLKEKEGQIPNGVKDKRGALVNGNTPVLKCDSENNTLTGYSSESGSSPLSWLADVALNSSRKLGASNAVDEEEESLKDVDANNPHYSTLRELLIRPTNNKNGKETKCDTNTSKKLAEEGGSVDTVDVSQRQIKSESNDSKEKADEKTLQYFTRRYVPIRNSDGLPTRKCSLNETKKKYPDVAHTWFCNGKLLALSDPKQKQNLHLFQEQWKRGQAVLVQNVHKIIDSHLWNVEEFSRNLGDTKNDLVDCKTGNVLPKIAMKKFWDGFESLTKRMKDEDSDYFLLKLKDWPPGDDFCERLPNHFEDLVKNLPLPDYTKRNGSLNLAGRLPDCFVRPDLGPKTYIAYGSPFSPDKGTTNLHLDISDAVNVMMYVGTLKGQKGEKYSKACLNAIDEGGCDELMRKRVREEGVKVGALWHIYDARDADKIRDLLNKVAQERGETLEPHHDPIHDQSWYLDDHLRKRLFDEYGVEGYAIAQCLGDAVFIPAGAPHQVRNLQSCIKIANDFVSPENVSQCFNLTQEFRQLSETHANHEDKLQIKNIIYHAVKDALASLRKNDNQDSD